MPLDYEKLKTARARGIFATGPEYAEWSNWASRLQSAIENASAKHALSSGPMSNEDYGPILAIANERPESAIHVILSHALKNAGWTHMRLLGDISGETPVPSAHAGRWYAQWADWMGWRERKMEASA